MTDPSGWSATRLTPPPAWDVEPFESAKLLLSWAREDLPAIARLTSIPRPPADDEIHVQVDMATGERVIFYTPRPISPGLRKLVSRLLNDLRHALDQSVWAATLLVTGKKKNGTHFPYADTAAEFEQLLDHPRKFYSDIPEALWLKLMKLEAWWRADGSNSGNDLIRGICGATGNNKHVVAVSPGVFKLAHEISSPLYSKPVPRNDAGRIEIGRTPKDFPSGAMLKLEIVTCIAMGERGLDTNDLATTLTNCVKEVESIILGIEAETARILAARS